MREAGRHLTDSLSNLDLFFLGEKMCRPTYAGARMIDRNVRAVPSRAACCRYELF